jgi:hypothetical protein
VVAGSALLPRRQSLKQVCVAGLSRSSVESTPCHTGLASAKMESPKDGCMPKHQAQD